MNGFGDALQYSVFACDLSAKERVLPEEAITELINHREDRVLIIDLGPAAGRGGDVVKTLGRQQLPPVREVLVVCKIENPAFIGLLRIALVRNLTLATG